MPTRWKKPAPQGSPSCKRPFAQTLTEKTDTHTKKHSSRCKRKRKKETARMSDKKTLYLIGNAHLDPVWL